MAVPVLAALLHQLQLLRGFEMLLLVYSSKPTSWQPDRSLQQHRALSLVCATFSVIFFLTSFTLILPSPSSSLVQSYTACSASLVLICIITLIILFIFLTILTKPSFSCHFITFSILTSSSWQFLKSWLKISLQRQPVIPEVYSLIIEEVSVEAPCCVSHYSGFFPTSFLKNTDKTVCSHFPSLKSCFTFTYLYVQLYSYGHCCLFLYEIKCGIKYLH